MTPESSPAVPWRAVNAVCNAEKIGPTDAKRILAVAAPFMTGYTAEQVTAAVEAERQRIGGLAERFSEPHRQPGTLAPETAVPMALLRAILNGEDGPS